MLIALGFFSEGTKDERQDPCFILVDLFCLRDSLWSGVSSYAFHRYLDRSLDCEAFRRLFVRAVNMVLHQYRVWRLWLSFIALVVVTHFYRASLKDCLEN